MNTFKCALVGVAGLLAAGCASDSGPKQTVGTLGGAAIGGLLGAQIGGGTGQLAATAAGVLLGAYLGSEVGKSLDRADKLHMQKTTQTSLETTRSGTVTSWANPDSGHSGTVTPAQAYTASNGQACRNFEQTVTVEGKTERATGTACRQPDGSWRVVN
ncbi:MAG: glycine zipper 2TM domain-containing protein [Alphaproteobacteria bacterium]|nr:glycine zipper 2TM domain-containing protein [Alphaproteobacteria bacterium]